MKKHLRYDLVPNVMSNKKNIMAHITEPVIMAIASG